MSKVENHNYAANPIKLARAIQQAKEEGKDGDDTRIKELYISFGGLVIEKTSVDTSDQGEESSDEETPSQRRRRLAAEKKEVEEKE